MAAAGKVIDIADAIPGRTAVTIVVASLVSSARTQFVADHLKGAIAVGGALTTDDLKRKKALGARFTT